MQAYASIKLLAADRTSGPARSAPLHVLVNRARRPVARQVKRRIAAACSRFLEIEVAGWGFVADDPQVAGRADEPFALGAPRSKAARHVGRLAKTVVRRMNRAAVTK
jgi:MinD-like ATPase involved in chromosome partitioning or flagellar assembly